MDLPRGLRSFLEPLGKILRLGTHDQGLRPKLSLAELLRSFRPEAHADRALWPEKLSRFPVKPRDPIQIPEIMYLESQWLIIMGYFETIMVYFGVQWPIISSYLAVQGITEWSPRITPCMYLPSCKSTWQLQAGYCGYLSYEGPLPTSMLIWRSVLGARKNARGPTELVKVRILQTQFLEDAGSCSEGVSKYQSTGYIPKP